MKLTKAQIEGVNWINKNINTYGGVLLADRAGLGKTAQAIELIKKYSNAPALVICPAYLTYNWKDELIMWGINAEDICVVDGGKQELYDAAVYVVSYNLASADKKVKNKKGETKSTYGDIFTQLYKKQYSIMVLDESHAVKSWNTLRSRRILGTLQAKKTNLKNRAERVLLMSGTPITRNIEDLYNQIIRIAPQALDYMSKDRFIQNFAGNIQYTPWGLKHHGVKNEKQLKLLLQDVMLSRKVITGLPPRIDRPIKIELKGAELKKYIIEENAFLQQHGITEQDIKKGQKITEMDAATIAETRQNVAIQKIPVLMKALADIYEKHDQVVIYCYHKKVVNAVQAALTQKHKNKKIAVVTGAVSMQKRAKIVLDYQAGKIDTILATIGALREGVTLTAGSAVLFLEFSWTPAEIEQAIARLHRKGQKDTVNVYYFYYASGIDKYIMRVLGQKRNMIKKIVGE